MSQEIVSLSLIVGCILWFGVVPEFAGQPSATNVSTNPSPSAVFPKGMPEVKTNGPDASHVFVTSNVGGWSVADLYETAAQWLAQNKQIPEQTRTNASLWINTEKNEVMCSFYFTDPKLFGKPVWIVELGFDGKVRACRHGVAVEKMPPGMKVPPPPPDPFDKVGAGNR